MDVIAELKKLRCDPGPVHSPNDECPCDMEAPCTCAVVNAAIDDIEAVRAARDTVGTFWSQCATLKEALEVENRMLREKLKKLHHAACEAAQACREKDVSRAENVLAIATRAAA